MKNNTFLTILFLCVCALFCGEAKAQKKGVPIVSPLPTFTPAKTRLDGLTKRQEARKNSLFGNVAFRSAGPVIMSGRVVDLDVNPDDPSHFFVAYASGGLWKTESNGSELTPLFDNEAVMTIGDIAVRWNNNRTEQIWVGTGENNSSRSSYSGAGIFRSVDNGKSWQHLGLEETHHIGRVILHPTNPETVWVAAIGHLYSPNPERGVFKTTDGGKTWQKTLFINNETGVIDLVIDSKNPDVLYAAAWERSRAAWDFKTAGKNSGIYKSTDGGTTWTKISGGSSGFPDSQGGGRIGLTVFPNNPNILYAVIDNNDNQESKKDAVKKEEPKLKPQDFKTMSKDDFLKIPKEDLSAYLKHYQFPQKYSAEMVIEGIKKETYLPKHLADYLGELSDANDNLFNTQIKGLEMYRSDDAGKTWKKTHEKPIEGVFFTYGYYFGQVRTDPNNDRIVYTFGVPVLKSEDAGKTWQGINGDNVHADHHALWINPKRKGHLILGNDGGVNTSYDDGKTWFKINNTSVGQFYSVAVDMEKPYNIYGGLQDNGVWYGASTYKQSLGWQDGGDYPYKFIMGGDGMQVQVDWRDNTTVYTGFQFGNYYRLNKKTGDSKYITPSHALGENPYRWNWQSPIVLSRHNQDVVYFGSNKFHRSLNKGDEFQTLSPDLTKGGKKGNVPYGTLTTIDESPKKFGLLYTGSDDGLIHVSKDGGYTWTKISDKLPQDFWVSRVVASAHAEGRVYATLNGYRFDNFEAHAYVSEDFGANWKRIGTNLPHEPVNVIREDRENENLLYLGTDHALYLSLDKGATFMAMSNMPATPVHDLVVQNRDKELIVGTHGRSFYVANVAHIQELNTEVLAKNLHIYALKNQTVSSRWGNGGGFFGQPFEPKTEIAFYAKQGGETMIRVLNADGLVLKTLKDEAEKGLNFVNYDLTFDESALENYQKAVGATAKKDVKIKKASNEKYYLQAGEYTVEVTINGTTEKQTLKIEMPK